MAPARWAKSATHASVDGGPSLRLLFSVFRCGWRIIFEVCIGDDGLSRISCVVGGVMVVVVRAARREGRWKIGTAETRPVAKIILLADMSTTTK